MHLQEKLIVNVFFKSLENYPPTQKLFDVMTLKRFPFTNFFLISQNNFLRSSGDIINPLLKFEYDILLDITVG